MRFSDTAGIRAEGADAIEAIGIDRAKAAVEAADILLWLGPPQEAPPHPRAILIAAQADRWRGDSGMERFFRACWPSSVFWYFMAACLLAARKGGCYLAPDAAAACAQTWAR